MRAPPGDDVRSGWCLTRRADSVEVGDGTRTWSNETADLDHAACTYAPCTCACHAADEPLETDDGATVALLDPVPDPTV